MATIKFDGIKEYQDKIMELGKRADGILKYAAYDAAGMVCDAIKAGTPEGDAGDLKRSVALQYYKNKNGYVYTRVVFSGYDSRGVPNAIKANVLTTGRKDQPGRKKNPWIRNAVKATQAAAVQSMKTNLDKKMKEIMEG